MNRKKILGIFPRSRSKKPSSKPGSGTATPSDKQPKSASSTGPKKSGEHDGYDDDDDDLPPREEEGDIGDLGHGRDRSPSSIKEEEEAVKNIPKTAGFDFAAISKALGKDIDVDRLPVPPEARSRAPIPSSIVVEDRPPLERSGSAPPSANRDEPEPEADEQVEGGDEGSLSKSHIHHPSRSFGTEGDDDDIGDIAGSTRDLSIHSHSASTTDLPNWDRPSATSPLSTESTSPGLPTSSFGGFNAWSPSPSPSPSPVPTPTIFTANGPIRSAPPARPHPAEFMANPFAVDEREKKSEPGSGFGFGNWGKKAEDPWTSLSSSATKKTGDDQWAEKNPW